MHNQVSFCRASKAAILRNNFLLLHRRFSVGKATTVPKHLNSGVQLGQQCNFPCSTAAPSVTSLSKCPFNSVQLLPDIPPQSRERNQAELTGGDNETTRREQTCSRKDATDATDAADASPFVGDFPVAIASSEERQSHHPSSWKPKKGYSPRQKVTRPIYGCRNRPKVATTSISPLPCGEIAPRLGFWKSQLRLGHSAPHSSQRLSNKGSSTTVQNETETKSTQSEPVSVHISDTRVLKHYPSFDIPSFENIVVTDSFISSINARLRVPNWVAERLTQEKVESEESKRNYCGYRYDPTLKHIFPNRLSSLLYSQPPPADRSPATESQRSDSSDQKPSQFTRDKRLGPFGNFSSYPGYTKGHLAAAGNHKSSKNGHQATFLIPTNIVPQNGACNHGCWKHLEEYCRELTTKFENVFVVSGPLWLPKGTRLPFDIPPPHDKKGLQEKRRSRDNPKLGGIRSNPTAPSVSEGSTPQGTRKPPFGPSDICTMNQPGQLFRRQGIKRLSIQRSSEKYRMPSCASEPNSNECMASQQENRSAALRQYCFNEMYHKGMGSGTLCAPMCSYSSALQTLLLMGSSSSSRVNGRFERTVGGLSVLPPQPSINPVEPILPSSIQTPGCHRNEVEERTRNSSRSELAGSTMSNNHMAREGSRPDEPNPKATTITASTSLVMQLLVVWRTFVSFVSMLRGYEKSACIISHEQLSSRATGHRDGFLGSHTGLKVTSDNTIEDGPHHVQPLQGGSPQTAAEVLRVHSTDAGSSGPPVNLQGCPSQNRLRYYSSPTGNGTTIKQRMQSKLKSSDPPVGEWCCQHAVYSNRKRETQYFRARRFGGRLQHGLFHPPRKNSRTLHRLPGFNSQREYPRYCRSCRIREKARKFRHSKVVVIRLIGKSQVAVPTHLFKVIAALDPKVVQGAMDWGAVATDESNALSLQNAAANEAVCASDSPKPISSDPPKPNSSDAPKPNSSDAPKPISSDSPKPILSDSPKRISSDSPKTISSDSPKPISSDSPKPISSDSPKPNARVSFVAAYIVANKSDAHNHKRQSNSFVPPRRPFATPSDDASTSLSGARTASKGGTGVKSPANTNEIKYILGAASDRNLSHNTANNSIVDHSSRHELSDLKVPVKFIEQHSGLSFNGLTRLVRWSKNRGAKPVAKHVSSDGVQASSYSAGAARVARK